MNIPSFIKSFQWRATQAWPACTGVDFKRGAGLMGSLMAGPGWAGPGAQPAFADRSCLHFNRARDSGVNEVRAFFDYHMINCGDHWIFNDSGYSRFGALALWRLDGAVARRVEVTLPGPCASMRSARARRPLVPRMVLPLMRLRVVHPGADSQGSRAFHNGCWRPAAVAKGAGGQARQHHGVTDINVAKAQGMAHDGLA